MATAVRSSDASFKFAASSLVTVLASLVVGLASVDGAWTTSVDGANSSVCSSAATTWCKTIGAISKLDATMETIVFFFMSISSLFVINTPIILCKRF